MTVAEAITTLRRLPRSTREQISAGLLGMDGFEPNEATLTVIGDLEGAPRSPEDDELDAVLRALESGDVNGARRLAATAAARWPDSQSTQHFWRVLQPPRLLATSPASGRDRRREFAWIRGHAAEYPGCWLAVFEDRLIAADPDLGRVTTLTVGVLGDEKALYFYSPPRTTE